MTVHCFICYLMDGYLAHFKLLVSKTVLWNIPVKAEKIICFSPRDNHKQTELCTQWMFMKWISKRRNTAANANVMFTSAQLESSVEVHDQSKSAGWLSEWTGWLNPYITLSYSPKWSQVYNLVVSVWELLITLL